MASLKFYLDARHSTENASLKIVVSHNNLSSLINIGVKVATHEWNKRSCLVVGRTDADSLNRYAASQMAAFTNALYDLRAEMNLSRLTAKEVKELLVAKVTPVDNKKSSFLQIFDKVISTRPSKGTQTIYGRTYRAIKDFDPSADGLRFEDITIGWLRDFEQHLSENSNTNTISIHFRNIRAVFNYAITEGVTDFYPFRKFKIKQGPVVKRSMTVEQLRTYLFAEGLPPHEARYRDYFALIFLLIGINTADLYSLKDITEEGRIVYDRAKTGKRYSIKVEPEAMEIINRQRGKKNLINIADTYNDYVNHRKRLNLSIRRVCKSLGLPEATTYWARHTWATIAHSLDIPIDTIAQSLGHDFGNQTTAIYINPSLDKVDRANRRVIDWVFYGEK